MVLAFRALWGLFLGLFVFFAFRRSWALEHGKPIPDGLGGKKNTKETVVWLSPLVFPLIVAFFGLLLMLIGGWDGVKLSFSLLLELMVFLSLYSLLLFLLLPLLRRWFSARACATLWVLPVFLFYQPHILLQTASAPHLVIPLPGWLNTWFIPLWGAVALAILIRRITGHLRFRYHLLREARPMRDPETLALWRETLDRAEYRWPVELMISDHIASPLSMGLTKDKRVTVLPDRAFTREELDFIFRHEVCHIQRRDVDTKIFLAFCGALCWFNPLVWLAIRQASADLELSCDELVLEGRGEAERRQYARLLLDSAGPAPGFTTCLSAAAGTMRYRLRSVMAPRRRLKGALLLGVSLFGCVLAYGGVAVAFSRGTAEEVILSRGEMEITAVYYQGPGDTEDHQVWAWDSGALLGCLADLPVAEVGTVPAKLQWACPRLSLVLDMEGTTTEITVDSRQMTFWPLGKSARELYLLERSLDWAAIAACLDLEAEEPAGPQVSPPQLVLRFDGDEDGLTATTGELLLWEEDSGNVLYASTHSEGPTALWGGQPEEVTLSFDWPVKSVTVTAKTGEDGAAAELTPLSGGEDAASSAVRFPLLPRSAVYTSRVTFVPREGCACEAAYRWEVEWTGA